MIARVSGLLASVGADSLVVDVNGVGYLVQASSRTLSAVGSLGAAVVLHIDTQVREESITLFGFLAEEERDWFRLLQSVQGVGGRVALAILSVLPPADLQTAIAMKDQASVARANGVGPKLAARIVNELKDKAGSIVVSGGVTAAFVAQSGAGGAVKDALSALGNLGFKPIDASRAVAEAQAELGEGATFGELVRVALKKSAR